MVNTSNEQTLKARAKRGRNALRMRYDDVLALIDDASCELNDSQVLKVMKLVFGLTQFMGSDHCYHEEQWSALARGLKLHSAAELLDLVMNAHVFMLKGQEGTRYFYFADYKQFHDHCDALVVKYARREEARQDQSREEARQDQSREQPVQTENREQPVQPDSHGQTAAGEQPVTEGMSLGEAVDALTEAFGCVVVSQGPMVPEDPHACTSGCTDPSTKSCTDSCTNWSKIADANTQNTSDSANPCASVGTGTGIGNGNKGDISPSEISPKVKDLETAVSASVKRLWTHEGPNGRLHGVRQQLLGLLALRADEVELAKVAFGYLMRRVVVQHLDRIRHLKDKPRDFALMMPEGQDAWLSQLVSSPKTGDRLLHQAADGVRPLLAKTRRELSTQHPNGPYEWFDATDGHRYYQDPTEGPMVIPDHLPARPSDVARLHPVTLTWYG